MALLHHFFASFSLDAVAADSVEFRPLNALLRTRRGCARKESVVSLSTLIKLTH
jgi:hypothetical protein